METRAAKRRRINSYEDNTQKNDEEYTETKTSDLHDNYQYNVTPALEIEKNIEKPFSVEILSIKSLMSSFDGELFEEFMAHCRNFLHPSILNTIEALTIDQADTPLWHQMRFGRVTASRIYQISRCKTKNGSLVESIMGKKSGWSFAMQRGTELEDKVFKILEKEFVKHNLKKCGIFLDTSLPHFAASPDGIADDFVVEIKCPATPKTYQEYLTIENLQPKYYGQIQLQMHITKRKKALLGVADLNFERTKKVKKVWIDYDDKYVSNLIESANTFWIEAIFPLLKKKSKSFYY
uniref:CSON002254 protein n=1 Tax=Culicoides sonorensis TaxID=179676 RepID=A0A336K6K5_CULSO